VRAGNCSCFSPLPACYFLSRSFTLSPLLVCQWGDIVVWIFFFRFFLHCFLSGWMPTHCIFRFSFGVFRFSFKFDRDKQRWSRNKRSWRHARCVLETFFFFALLHSLQNVRDEERGWRFAHVWQGNHAPLSAPRMEAVMVCNSVDSPSLCFFLVCKSLPDGSLC